jgi:hypothetical protein
MKGNKKPVSSPAAKIVTPRGDSSTDPVVNPDFVSPDKPSSNIKPLIDPTIEKATDTPETAAEPAIVRGFRQIKRLSKWDLVVIGFVLLLIAGFGIYAGTNSPAPPVKVSTSTSSASTSLSDHAFKSATCSSKSCLNAAYAKCSPASYYASSSSAKIRYQIYGSAGNGCVMYYQYAWSPNPTWVNQAMTCDFDGSTSLDNAVAEAFNDLSVGKNTYQCTGPLVALLQAS